MMLKTNDTADAPTRATKSADDAMEDVLNEMLIDRSARQMKCLQALRTAGIPLDMDTADVLVELGERMSMVIREALDREDAAIASEG